MVNKISKIEKEFLRQSNKIEGVHDAKSLEQAIYAWQHLLERSHISSFHTCRAHKILMLYQDLKEYEKGTYRGIPVYIAGRECPTTYGGLNLDFAMQKWCEDADKDLENWKKHHIEFEKIHPFVDGNGRIGRMLMNWMRVKSGLPILVIKASERQEYYKWFI